MLSELSIHIILFAHFLDFLINEITGPLSAKTADFSSKRLIVGLDIKQRMSQDKHASVGL